MGSWLTNFCTSLNAFLIQSEPFIFTQFSWPVSHFSHRNKVSLSPTACQCQEGILGNWRMLRCLGTCCINQAGPELIETNLLPECWEWRRAPPCPAAQALDRSYLAMFPSLLCLPFRTCPGLSDHPIIPRCASQLPSLHTIRPVICTVGLCPISVTLDLNLVPLILKALLQ